MEIHILSHSYSEAQQQGLSILFRDCLYVALQIFVA